MILLDIQFGIDPARRNTFVAMYRDEYVPALQRQIGYIGSSLLAVYSDDVVQEIGAVEAGHTLAMQLRFDTEENRRSWVASDDHQRVWARAVALSEHVQWIGYDVVGHDGD